MNIPAPILAPLAITEEGLNQLAELARNAGPGGLTKKNSQPLEGTRSASIRDGVAIIPVTGPLFKSENIFTWLFGSPSYDTILEDIIAALDDDGVHAVVLDLNSPGGEAFGCGELSAAIFEARGDKPIVGYVSGMCCSAAYWIGSACDRLVVDASSMVGSIGVRQLLVDDSKRDEAMGVKEHQIVSGQSPYKVVDASSESDRGRVKDTMTAMASVFIADVARNRGVSETKVSKDFGRGDVFIGKQAVEAGMADEVGDLETLLAELQPPESNKRSFAMAKKTGAPNAAMGDEKCTGCDRDMDDGDELYCAACHGGADSKALFAAIGAKTIGEAVATVTGWKQAAAETAVLREQIAKQEASAREAQFDAAIAAATMSGVIPPSADHPKRVFALSLRGQKDGTASLAAYVAALGPTVAISTQSAATAATSEPAGGGGSVVILTAREKSIAQAMGISLESLQKNKARLLALASAPPPADSGDEEDDKDAA